MTFNAPISRTELLNQLSEEWYANSADDIYPPSLVAPPPVRPPATIAATEAGRPLLNHDVQKDELTVSRDRATAALLIGLLR